MTKLEFMSSVISACIWPITVLAILFFIKPLINRALSKLVELSKWVELKYGDLSLVFSKQIQKLDENKPTVLNKTKLEIESGDTRSEYLKELIILEPRLSIIEAWRYVEIAAYHLLHDKLKTDTFKLVKKSVDIIDVLEKNAIISKELIQFMKNLHQLRNQATHSEHFSVNKQDANQFAHNALSVVSYLEYLRVK
jgi:hypothetical protein